MSDPSENTSQRRFGDFADTDEADADVENSAESDSNADSGDNTVADETDPDVPEDDGGVPQPQQPAGRNGLPVVDGESFNEFWFRKTAERNIEENHPERNDPSHSWPIGRFEPHQLGNCQRQWFYHWLNAPSEESDPHGIFAVGHFIEEEIVEPWLHDLISPEYDIDNAIHVSVDIDEIPVDEESLEQYGPDIDTGIEIDIPESIGYNQPDDTEPDGAADTACLTIAGSTDPAICDPDSGEVLALTEVKSTGSLDRINKPKRMHLMQIHAYMKALDITDGYVIYVDRNELLNPKAFEIEFDENVWNTVVEWVESTMEYAVTGTLPPADAPENWMCRYCEYSNRCGEGRSNLAEDMGPRGFVPGYTEYPKNKVEDHLEAYPDVALTPSLALKYPELAKEHDVTDWVCPNCTASFDYTDAYFAEFENENFATPGCPACEEVLDRHVYLKTEGF